MRQAVEQIYVDGPDTARSDGVDCRLRHPEALVAVDGLLNGFVEILYAEACTAHSDRGQRIETAVIHVERINLDADTGIRMDVECVVDPVLQGGDIIRSQHCRRAATEVNGPDFRSALDEASNGSYLLMERREEGSDHLVPLRVFCRACAEPAQLVAIGYVEIEADVLTCADFS